jgi:energy-coupling factor transporter ATP-binding protein EcfA2
MQLLELSLRNFNVHRKVDLKFDPGVVGIVGKNGSGKSSIISAICFLFTGDLDGDKKADRITVGETEGWVKGKFLLNGKEGTLERHLSVPKVSLTYDGMTYNKVSEVNALWNELLQIDTTIFNNVIVAKQGEIQNLFSDESVVREKIFQKIFMVPETEKLRNTIWNKYVKECPPEKPEEDVQLLITSQTQVAKNRNEVLAKVETLTTKLASPAIIASIKDRLFFLDKCQQDSKKRPELETEIYRTNEELRLLDGQIETSESVLENYPDEEELRTKIGQLTMNKVVFGRKQSILREIENLDKQNLIDFAAVTKAKETLQQSNAHLYETLTEMNGKLRDIIAQKNHLSALEGHASCPTCKQDIPDSKQYLADLRVQESALSTNATLTNSRYQAQMKHLQQYNQELAKYEGLMGRKEYLVKELEPMSTLVFTDEELIQAQTEHKLVKDLQASLNDLRNRKVVLSSNVKVAEEKLKSLATHEGSAPIEQELTMFREALELDDKRREEIGQFQLQSGKLEHELVLLEQRINNSHVNSKYNAKRKSYLEALTNVYDVFATAKFPRRLIETYMDHVQVSLATYLEYFNLPYTVKVVDGFKIRLFTEHDKMLPSVSGGQEMMVGICLRLALHKMFAKAFPIWIIDEGTTHLSDDNRQNYFNLINELRNQKVINQIIIIDHDERLSEVVDQTIQL